MDCRRAFSYGTSPSDGASSSLVLQYRDLVGVEERFGNLCCHVDGTGSSLVLSVHCDRVCLFSRLRNCLGDRSFAFALLRHWNHDSVYSSEMSSNTVLSCTGH